MQGWKLFKHALRMVVGNWRDAIRIFWMPCLLIGLIFVWVLRTISPIIAASISDVSGSAAEPVAGSFAMSFLLMLLAFFIIGWGIVAWHRYILLEERPSGVVPPLRLDRIMAYFGRLILLGLACAICGLPLMMLGTAVVGPNPIAGTLFVMFVISVAISVLMYRWIAILPAAALGKPLTFGEAFAATSGATGAILVLMLIVWVVSFGGQYVVDLLQSVSPVASGVFDILFTSILGLVNISILTTFYGHYVEGRSID